MSCLSTGVIEIQELCVIQHIFEVKSYQICHIYLVVQHTFLNNGKYMNQCVFFSLISHDMWVRLLDTILAWPLVYFNKLIIIIYPYELDFYILALFFSLLHLSHTNLSLFNSTILIVLLSMIFYSFCSIQVNISTQYFFFKLC
jgi:hypothetical protein